MPIEIKELHIKVTVADNQTSSTSSTGSADMSQQEKKRLLKDCLEQVTEIIKNKKER
jgi:Family of unknown function (DUF5908)